MNNKMFFETVDDALVAAMREVGNLLAREDMAWMPYGIIVYKRKEHVTYPDTWVYTVYPNWAAEKFEEDLEKDLRKTAFDLRATLKL